MLIGSLDLPNPPLKRKIMPLVVPGLTSSSKDKTEHWQQQLMGKKLGDTTDEVVRHDI